MNPPTPTTRPLSTSGSAQLLPHLQTRPGRAWLVEPERLHLPAYLFHRWARWIHRITPRYLLAEDPWQVHSFRLGQLVDPDAWPPHPWPRVYAAFDETDIVYVGQTTMTLAARMHGHFGGHKTRAQKLKAGTWSYVVSAAFLNLRHGDLDVLEKDAADTLLSKRTRAGRRHPRTPHTATSALSPLAVTTQVGQQPTPRLTDRPPLAAPAAPMSNPIDAFRPVLRLPDRAIASQMRRAAITSNDRRPEVQP